MRKAYLSKILVLGSGVLVSAGLAFATTDGSSGARVEGYHLAQAQQAGQPQAQQDQKKIEVVTVEFEANQHNLSQEAREKLREKLQMYGQAAGQQTGRAGGEPMGTGMENRGAGTPGAQQDKVQSIKVAAWSDQEFTPEQDLPEPARELAKNRAEAVENFITEELNIDTDVTTFNMAEQAGLLARTFNTQEAELRSLFAREGGPDEARIEAKNPELIHIRDEGGPSKAVVVISKEYERNGAGTKTRQ